MTASPRLQILEEDVEGPKATRSLRGRRLPLSSPEVQLEWLGQQPIAPFADRLRQEGWSELQRAQLEIFQINVGKLCNMTCRHCHVDAGPDRTDSVMSRETAEACLAALDRTTAHTVDLTGGAPELNPQFRFLVEGAKERGLHVIDRCNLTILMTRKLRDLPEWMAEREVEVVCSLPHFGERNTDAQRGDGTFEKSIAALKRLNEVGYGRGDPKRVLTLMSNPAGAFLSGSQAHMEREWKRQLERRHGVTFDRLFALNNMPISRYLEWLVETGNDQAYMERLVNAFNPATVAGLMCRNTLSVSWDGWVYDCDFNQMLDMRTEGKEGPLHIRDFDPEHFASRPVKTAAHCYGCTAGSGSSCAGATS